MASEKHSAISEGRRRSNANLRPFVKGKSGNPKGRPKKQTLSEALRAALEQVGKGNLTNAELLAEAILRQAKKGNVKAFTAIADRTEGKPLQQIEQQHSGRVQIEYVNDWREAEGARSE